ncbi:hypothetical protein A7Q26_18350 [Sphingobium sp. TCM1]|nr:hypothetical protein A7Q26_18350 [Sphingobium sp. TCM1]
MSVDQRAAVLNAKVPHAVASISLCLAIIPALAVAMGIIAPVEEIRRRALIEFIRPGETITCGQFQQ